MLTSYVLRIGNSECALVTGENCSILESNATNKDGVIPIAKLMNPHYTH